MVTAVVPTWNRRDLLESLLAGLAAQTMPPETVVVVDNGSTDGSAEAAEKRGACVIRMGANQGFARAVNAGVRQARTRWVAVLNNDVELEPHWLERLSAAAEAGDAWFASGKIYDAARRSTIDGTWDCVSRGACAWRAGSGRRDGPLFSEPRRILMASGTAALFRTDLFQRIGYFEELFESHLEDVDLGLRCASAGLHGIYVPGAVAWHQGSATMGRWNPETVRRISRNQMLLVARHYSRAALLANAWHVLAGQVLWALVAARHGCAAAFLQGKLQGLRMFAQVRKDSAPQHTVIAVLRQSEREIYDVQMRCGFDVYWKWYFRLTGGAK